MGEALDFADWWRNRAFQGVAVSAPQHSGEPHTDGTASNSRNAFEMRRSTRKSRLKRNDVDVIVG